MIKYKVKSDKEILKDIESLKRKEKKKYYGSTITLKDFKGGISLSDFTNKIQSYVQGAAEAFKVPIDSIKIEIKEDWFYGGSERISFFHSHMETEEEFKKRKERSLKQRKTYWENKRQQVKRHEEHLKNYRMQQLKSLVSEMGPEIYEVFEELKKPEIS